MKYLIIIWLFVILISANAQTKYELPASGLLLDISKDSMMTQIGIKELTGKNDGPEIDKYQVLFGLRNAPYCAMGLYWCYHVARDRKSVV